ncbi:hypothetical protein FB45DRAFT_1135700 [Roridomyces roridus]|uniref:Uncharacterized protein n=1 Tax=Roridomyces roridus TaxID=1738132 RepID=A0AAD7FAE5_9AGAR|nr:hypothetical protein FB45DRAFT_1135700 [Roridomyces roridus]
MNNSTNLVNAKSNGQPFSPAFVFPVASLTFIDTDVLLPTARLYSPSIEDSRPPPPILRPVILPGNYIHSGEMLPSPVPRMSNPCTRSSAGTPTPLPHVLSQTDAQVSLKDWTTTCHVWACITSSVPTRPRASVPVFACHQWPPVHANAGIPCPLLPPPGSPGIGSLSSSDTSRNAQDPAPPRYQSCPHRASARLSRLISGAPVNSTVTPWVSPLVYTGKRLASGGLGASLARLIFLAISIEMRVSLTLWREGTGRCPYIQTNCMVLHEVVLIPFDQGSMGTTCMSLV